MVAAHCTRGKATCTLYMFDGAHMYLNLSYVHAVLTIDGGQKCAIWIVQLWWQKVIQCVDMTSLTCNEVTVARPVPCHV